MGRKSGNTLIEALFALSICSLMVLEMGVLFKQLSKLELNYSNDLSYCLYSLACDVSLASSVEVNGEELILYEGNEQSFLYLDNQRLVKSPGFNIYLHHVDAINFSHDDNYVYMSIQRGEQNETFQIGVYYRPSFRVCEFDESCDDEDTIVDDSVDDTVD